MTEMVQRSAPLLLGDVSPLQLTLAAVVIMAIGALLWVRAIRPRLRAVRNYMNKVTTTGYMPPPPGTRAQKAVWWIGRIITLFQVGRVKVYGKENLKDLGGPKMLCANHGSHADPPISALLTGGKARFIATDMIFTFARGLGALIFGPLGIVPCNLGKGKGRAARDVCINVLSSKQDLVLFPEGISWADGKVREFKKGAVYIVKAAAEALGEPTYIVPYYIRYNKYAGEWILKYRWVYQYFWIFLNAWYYRRGATVVIGKPIRSDEFPADDTAGTAFLREKILELDPLVNKPEGRGEWLTRI